MPSTTTAKTGAARTGTARKTKAANAKTASKSSNKAAEDTLSSAAAFIEEEDEINEDVNEINEEPLKDTDEIEVVSLIPHVGYRDFATSDYYEWENVGDVEYMTFDALARMRRNFRSYFDDMCLKPNDARVIKKFGLERFYKQYDAFMNASSYTRENISDTLDKIHGIRSNSMKSSIVNKIKAMVSSGEISDVNVIRTIEKRFDLDLIATL